MAHKKLHSLLTRCERTADQQSNIGPGETYYPFKKIPIIRALQNFIDDLSPAFDCI